MNHPKSTPDEIEKIREERNLYARLLHEANLRFEGKVNELSLLKRVGDIITDAFDLESFCRKLATIIIEETNAENCSLLLKEPSSGCLLVKVASGTFNQETTFYEDIKDSSIYFTMGEGIAGKVALEGKPILVNDIKNDGRFDHRRKTNISIGSILCCPLMVHEELLGVINLSNSQPNAFSDDEVRTLSLFSNVAASILKNALVYAELKESEEKFRAVFDGACDALLILDPTSQQLVDCNSQLEEWLGYSKEALAPPHQVLNTILPDAKTQRYFNKILKDIHREKFYEIAFLKKNGSTTSGEVRFSPIEYLGKKFIQLAIRDVTEKKEMEERLFRSEKFRALGELAGGVAHDFNNILAAILGRVQLLLKSLGSLPPEEWTKSTVNMKKGLEIIESAALDGSDILRRLQEFYRIRKDDKNFSLVDLNTIVTNALELTQVKWKNEAEVRGIVYQIKKELSPLSPVEGCESELREVVVNLITNALDAMPQGGTILIKTFQEAHHANIVFQDTGTGIPSSICKRIFDPFFTTKGQHSSGLGLSVSYGIIKRHRGDISVQSKEGQGSVFSIKIPIAKKKLTVRRKQEKTDDGPRKTARILVVEDEETVREVLSDILTTHGYEVSTASNGKEGVELFQHHSYDFVFTDLGMPGMSGWQVAEAIKNINPEVPIAVITGWQIPLDESHLKERGVDTLIAKPFKIEQILDLAQKWTKTSEKSKESN